MSQRYANFIIQHRYLVILVTFLAVVAMTAGLQNFNMASNFRVYFSPDNPQLLAFEEMEDEFNKQDNLLFLVVPDNENIFTKDALSLIWELTEAGWELPYASRSSSITNHQHTAADGDDLTVDFLLEYVEDLEQEGKIDAIRNIALSEPTLQNNYMNKEGSVAGVIINLEPDEDDSEANKNIVLGAEAILERIASKYPDIKVMLGGTSTTSAAISQVFEEDVGTLVAATYVVFMIILVIMLRTLSGMLLTMVVIMSSTLSAYGIFLWFNAQITPTQGFVPTAITAIAIADVVHILVSYYHELRHQDSKEEAIKEALRINAQPIFITSISTAIGVLCLNASDAPPYQLLGNMIAFGVMMAYVMTMTVVPAALAILPAPKVHATADDYSSSHPMIRLSEWIIRNRRILLPIGLLVTVVSGYSITNNQFSERWNEYFDESYEIRQVIEKMEDTMSGVHRFQYTIRSKDGENGIYTPAYLNDLEAFANWYRQHPKVGHVETLTDTFKRLNQNLNGDDPAFYKIPESKEEAAQFALLYEFSLPQGLGLENIQNLDKSATRMSVLVHKVDSQEMIDIDKDAIAWVNENAPNLVVDQGTGLDIIFAHMAIRNIKDLVLGSAAALVLISIILMFALRSIRMGLISLIPNIIPILIAYGIWGLMKAEISLSVSVVISISLGIVVDDTVHFLSKYLRARKEKGLNTPDAIRYAFRTVGVALVTTSMVLVAGFSLMLLAHFNPSKDMGTLLAMAIGLALIVDFFLLPPLLMAMDKRKYVSKEI